MERAHNSTPLVDSPDILSCVYPYERRLANCSAFSPVKSARDASCHVTIGFTVVNKWYLKPCLDCRAACVDPEFGHADKPVQRAHGRDHTYPILSLGDDAHCSAAEFCAFMERPLPPEDDDVGYAVDVYRALAWLQYQATTNIGDNSFASARYQACYLWALEWAQEEAYSSQHFVVRFLLDECVQLHRGSALYETIRRVFREHFRKRLGTTTSVPGWRALLKRARNSVLGIQLPIWEPSVDAIVRVSLSDQWQCAPSARRAMPSSRMRPQFVIRRLTQVLL
jgi:hypothetical protein